MIDELLSPWDVGALEKQAGTNKLFYRRIGGYKYQFHKVDYKQRTRLVIEAAAAMKGVAPLFDELRTMPEDATETEIMVAIMPSLIAALATPELQPFIENMCSTVAVDTGVGKFEPLSLEPAAERVFGEDLTLQIPVAITAALVNFDGLQNVLAAIK